MEAASLYVMYTYINFIVHHSLFLKQIIFYVYHDIYFKKYLNRKVILLTGLDFPNIDHYS